MEQQAYHKNKSWEEALEIMMRHLVFESIPQNEVIDVRKALGRITGEIVRAKRSSPHFRASAMDGYAVRVTDTYGITERDPRWLALGIEAMQVDTGDPMPEGMDAMIMWEKVLERSEKGILVQEPVVPWENVRSIGEDIVEGEVLLPPNHRIRPQDQGALIAAGVLELAVRCKPRVGILPTGDEIRSPGEELKVGEIVDSNSTVLSSMVEECGGLATVWPILPDRPNQLEEALLQMVESQEIIVLIAGTSQGRDDYTAKLIKEYGTLFVHGVAIKPGKPVILGEIQGKPVMGIPGYPVSAFLTAQLFLKPWITRLLGISKLENTTLKAVLSKKVFSTLGSEEFVRVKLGKVGERWVAAPLSRGAGITMSLVRADGILRVPRLQEGYHEGQNVTVELIRTVSEIEDAFVCIGSHDLTLDLISCHLKNKGLGSISSAHVGSLAGILALRKGEAHFAGIHLLDTETGEYNISYLEKLLPGRKIALVNLVYRTQGFLVAKGNPLNLKKLSDLAQPGIRFINRQGGSGTRVLFDHLLSCEGIKKEQISGYEREEFTHLGVAVAVSSGAFDVGLGIQSAAVAMDLDFIPIGEERYDLAIPKEHFEDSRMQTLLRVIQSEEFKKDVLELGGYDVRDIGKVIVNL
jgi:putative molybdopterin biosynthesis protein